MLRQDPDVILIGELRDPESIRTALSAAETGHLVLSTLHTQGAAKSINRIVDVFPADQQQQIRTQLGDTLQGVISQTLLPLSQTNGRTIATEVLINTPAVANMIREGQVAQLYSAMQAGSQVGMHTLDQDLRRLVEEGTIALNVATDFAVDPQSLDGVHVRPRSRRRGVVAARRRVAAGGCRDVAPANAAAGTGVGMGSRFGDRGRVITPSRRGGLTMAVVQEFVYRAVDPRGGSVVKGTIEAPSESAVTGKLKAQGLTPLEVTLKSKTGLNREIKLPGCDEARLGASRSRSSRGRWPDSSTPACRSCARSSILIEQTDDKKLQPALVQVQADVEIGSSFSAALARHPQTFPPLMLSIVRVGETGGFLGAALTSIAENYQREAELQNKIRAAVTYPIIVLIIAILGVLAMVTFIVPVFENMFAGLGSALPLPTQILVTISNNMWWILPRSLIVVDRRVVIWWRANKHTEQVRRVVDPIKLKMPIFGKLTTKIAVARFTRNLSMMLNAGVPIIQALVDRRTGIEQLEDRAGRARHPGVDPSGHARSPAPLAKAEVFPPMVSQMVSVGEESGTLVEMLASIADFYEDEVETATAQLSSTIEPILIVGLGIVIGGMVISLYLPIFTLYGEIANQ